MADTAKCSECGNMNAVLVSTGFKKPENKGKKYFTCAGCGKFQWVESEVASTTELQPAAATPTTTETTDSEVWEAKDRMGMAQSALKAASEVYSALKPLDLTEKTFEELREDNYNWLLAKRGSK